MKYGWLIDKPDPRDSLYLRMPALETMADLPPVVDLRNSWMPPVDNQELEDCTANGMAAMMAYEMAKQGEKPINPSRLFIYYNERLAEGMESQDSGAQPRDGFKSLATQGVCDETLWPYDPTQFAIKPPDAAYQAATAHTIKKYCPAVQTIPYFRGILAEKCLIGFGITVYPSFENVGVNGLVPMPDITTEPILGYHFMVMGGFDDKNQFIIVRNSWDTTWGDKGYCYIPYGYFTNPSLTNNFWQLTLVS